ncbi:hypothetical protein FS837_005954, partial [Tulasnella sp. UAMH 9824]
KASVDDQGKIILTPEVDGPPHNFEESVEQLVETAWAEFFRAGRYRELRVLGYALAGNANAVLGKSPREFKTSASASQYLRQFWASSPERYLSWPSEIKGSQGMLEPGDLGVFEVQPGKGKVFRKLQSVSAELGGIKTKINASDFEEVQPCVHRLKDAQAEQDWLCANATRIAAIHSVSPEDLVLLTKTTHGLDVKPLERLSRRIQKPIYFYVHIAADGTAFKRYWTFQDSPLDEDLQELSGDPELSELPLPGIKMYFGDYPFPAQYLQLEIGDF